MTGSTVRCGETRLMTLQIFVNFCLIFFVLSLIYIKIRSASQGRGRPPLIQPCKGSDAYAFPSIFFLQLRGEDSHFYLFFNFVSL